MNTSHAIAPGSFFPTRGFLKTIGGFPKMLRLLSSRAAGSNNVVRVIEDWLDSTAPDRFYWRKREHPEYQVSFELEVRGQRLDMFIDYDASDDFLGMYAYLRTKIDKDARASLLETLNRLNFGISYGNTEMDMDSGTIRFRVTADMEGIRLSPQFLTFMLRSAKSFYEVAIPELLHGPQSLVA